MQLPRTPDLQRREPDCLAVAAVLLVVATAVAGCGDDDGSGTGPIAESFFSFESGLAGWRADSADFCDHAPGSGACVPGGAFATTEVDVVTEPASDFPGAVRLVADNTTDAVKLWIERPFPVTPGGAYRVDVSWDLGTSDGEVGAWTVIAAVTPGDPDAAFRPGAPGDRVGDFRLLGSTAAPGGTFEFVPHSFTDTLESAPAREVWVGLGVWGTFEVERTYFLDAVRVRIERVG